MFEEIELSDPSHHPAPPLVVPLKCFPLEHTCVKKLQLSSKSMLQPLQPGLKQKSEEHHGEWPRQSVGMSVVSASQNNSAREEPCYNWTIGHISVHFTDFTFSLLYTTGTKSTNNDLSKVRDMTALDVAQLESLHLS